ncbi:MAG: response regulator [Candidatus Woesearchaeota archaeon]|nr:MAG: response regulator [Candidatus Woesearchaeota archaeon]
MTKVLIVEDDANIALAEAEILKAEGYDVVIAKDGLEGLDKAVEHKPVAVVLDLMMPKLSGIEVCRRIREDPSLKHTKVVMVTAKDTDQDEAYGMHVGADDYLAKPFEPIELVHILRQVLK